MTFASSIPAVLLLAPVLDRVGFVTESGSDVRVLVGCLLDVVNALACVGTAVALWPVVRRTHPTLALGFLASRIIEGAVIMIGVVCLLGVVTLRRDVGGAGHPAVELVDGRVVAGAEMDSPESPPST